jgi:hypothetical protein
MGLNFPNASRSFNPDRQSVTFWASDRALEFTFELDHSALSLINAKAQSEQEYLQSFDDNRKLIEAAALRAYKLDAASFRILTKDSF